MKGELHMEIASERLDDMLSVVEVARNTGKIRKGVNEVTKSIERGQAQLVLVATDASPAEIVLHIRPLCKEKHVAFSQAGTKEELGVAAGLHVGTVAIAVVDAGEAKKAIRELTGATTEAGE